MRIFKRLLLLMLIPLLGGCTYFAYTGEDYDFMNQSKIESELYYTLFPYTKSLQKNVSASFAIKEFSDNFKGNVLIYLLITNNSDSNFSFNASSISFYQNSERIIPYKKEELQSFLDKESEKINKQLNIEMKEEINTYKEVAVEIFKDEFIRKSADVKSLNWYKKISEDTRKNYLEGEKTVGSSAENHYFAIMKYNPKFPIEIKFEDTKWHFTRTLDSIWNY